MNGGDEREFDDVRLGRRRPRRARQYRWRVLEQLLLRLAAEYQVPKVYVTESGSAWPDDIGPDGHIADGKRTQYLLDHIAAAASAARHGVPLAGYFAWSLMDNFEWAYGYEKRFGLIHVDYQTQARTIKARTIKASGHRYAQLIASTRAST